jgi:hypothetical protein
VIAGANAICASTVAAIRAEPASAAGVIGASKLVVRELRELRGLTPPQQRRASYRRFLQAEAEVSRRYSALAAAERAHGAGAAQATVALARAAAGAVTPARRYGLTQCAGAGATVGDH